MIVATEELRAVYRFLFKTGCLVVEDNKTLENHPYVGISNIKVLKAMKLLRAKKLVDKQFVWRHSYYRLNDKGICWMREKLYLDAEELPITHTAMPLINEQTPVVAEGAPKFRRN
jgi:small subunit ribosomal protein S10e